MELTFSEEEYSVGVNGGHGTVKVTTSLDACMENKIRA